MDIVTVIATSVSAASAVAGAVVAIIIAILTAKTLDVYKKQVQIGQNQIHATQEQTYKQARPVLIPPTNIQGMMRTEQGRTFLHRASNRQSRDYKILASDQPLLSTASSLGQPCKIDHLTTAMYSGIMVFSPLVQLDLQSRSLRELL